MTIRNNNRRGFTLIEMLVVVLILATLMAVALPLYLSSVKDASKKTCRSNMQSISNAAQAWKVKTRATDFSGLTAISMLAGDLGNTPTCPDAGTYALITTGTTKDADNKDATVPAGGLGVTCTATDHGGFIPGVTAN